MYLTAYDYQIELYESGVWIRRNFMCVGLDGQRILRKWRWGTPDELLARILDAAASIKKR